MYAATGSQIPGVTVIDTGVDPGSLAATLYRAGGSANRDPAPAGPAFARAYTAARENRYDLIHNHAFDAPAISLAAELGTPVVHTLHLPPDAAIAAALRQAALRQAAGAAAPAVACVSAFQAGSWRAVARVDAILPPYVPTRSVPWSDTAGDGVVFAGRLSPEKGAAEAIDIAQAAGARIDVYGDVYDAGYARDQIAPRGTCPAWRCIRESPAPPCGQPWPAQRWWSARPAGTNPSAWRPPTLRRAGLPSSRSSAAGSPT